MVPAAKKMDADERRASILSAAIPLFAAKGLEGVKTREIAEAAGVSEALLYRHFPSKDALFAEVQCTCLAGNAEDVERLGRLPDTTSTLVLAVYLVVRRVSGGPSVSEAQRATKQLLLRSLLETGDFARGFLKQASAPWVDKLTRCWHGARAAGDLVPDAPEPDVGVWLAHHLAFGLSSFYLVTPPVQPLPVAGEALQDATTRFALRGIGVRHEAIAAHFNPEAFRLLAAGAPGQN